MHGKFWNDNSLKKQTWLAGGNPTDVALSLMSVRDAWPKTDKQVKSYVYMHI